MREAATRVVCPCCVVDPISHSAYAVLFTAKGCKPYAVVRDDVVVLSMAGRPLCFSSADLARSRACELMVADHGAALVAAYATTKEDVR